MRLFCLFTLNAVLTAGCGSGSQDAGSPDAAPAPDVPSSTGAFDPLTGTLDRAAGVEDTLLDAAAERRRQLEAQE